MADALGPRLKEPLFERITIIGLGLIGSSLARVARAKNLARVVMAVDSSIDVCSRVVELAIADEVTSSAEVGVRDADFVVLCIPVGANAEVARAIGPHLKAGAIVSDVGSVKASAVASIAPHLPQGVSLVPAHPVAGTEFSGPDAGFATLFVNRWCILTPPEGTDASATERVRAFWAETGSNVEVMGAEHHDLVLAITSHVPHLIAFNIVGTAAHLEQVTNSEVIKFSAGGFRDFTRIAASDPTMWRDIFLNNREAVLEMLSRFNADLASLADMVSRGDGDALFDLFSRTRAIRRSIIQIGQETPNADFGRLGAANDTKAP
jgi:cyclohexadieny/prephenate dehydrogenase